MRLTTYDGLQSDLARCVILLAILRKHCSQSIGGHSLILREAPRQIIRIRAQIHEIEHDRKDLQNVSYHPEIFEGDVLVCDDFKGLIQYLDEAAILTSASDDSGIALAIRVALFKHSISQNEDLDWEDVPTPIVGSAFRTTCHGCCVDQSDSLPVRVLRSIVETIRNQNLSGVHALRSGLGGNSPQHMRGNDKAQRRDIDREFHLHYWACANGEIELASVVYHNDFSIPE